MAKALLDTLLAIVLFLGICMFMALLSGCASNRDASTDTKRSKRVDTVTTQQVVVGEKIVKLTSRTTVVENEDTGTVFNERVEVEAPQVLQDLGTVALEAGKKVADSIVPGSGYLVETITGLAGLGAGGAGIKAMSESRRRRKLEEEQEEAEERQRKVNRAMKEYADDIEEAETDDEITAIKKKHEERQRRLGIYDDVMKARHG